ncbi:MAG: hypothetical protein VKJ86_09695 [Synechococcus sp.]|nr:hypothetical protein [Synechococcus sp.]
MNFHDHDDLIRFLRDHDPSGPPPNPDHEEELFVRLGQDKPATTFSGQSSRWWLPTMVAAGCVLVVGHRHLEESFQRMPGAFNATFTPAPVPVPRAIANRDQELEAFLEQSWTHAFGEHFYQEESFATAGGSDVNFVVNTAP